MTPQMAEIALADIKDFLVQLMPNNLDDIAKLESEEHALHLLRKYFTEQDLAVIQHALMFAPSDTYEGMSGRDILDAVNASKQHASKQHSSKQQAPVASPQEVPDQAVKMVSVSGTQSAQAGAIHAVNKMQNLEVKVSAIETATSAVSDKFKAVDEEG
ncbi:hypothetical protein DXX93_15100 [Thalassotalea euphylliae]|uniref:Uncharacterized protein n=1 Tax=Thalassotalea euphylliae TaxID=1655234 RepID=A0A3E0TUZ2_9GAMM|nr:hypothetical protein [Thalassotalea euphylliae]REL27752.1 hypothetical protein DXX93_15100 [Thalassotalea euphylliae]